MLLLVTVGVVRSIQDFRLLENAKYDARKKPVPYLLCTVHKLCTRVVLKSGTGKILDPSVIEPITLRVRAQHVSSFYL